MNTNLEIKVYDDDGNVKKTFSYDSSGAMVEYFLTEYAGTQVDKTKHYKPDGTLYIEKEYVYGRNFLKNSKYYNADGSINHKNTYDNSPRGSIFESVYYLSDGSFVTVRYGFSNGSSIVWEYPDGTKETKYTDDWKDYVSLPEVIDFDKVNYK